MKSVLTENEVNLARGYTEEEKYWLCENYPNLGIKETARQFNEKFNRNKKPKTIQRYCTQSLNLCVTQDYLDNKRYWFTSPVGTVSKNCRGEWKIKTENGWELLTRSMFKNIPKGYIIVHLDCDKDNNSKENLVMIKNGVQTTLRNWGMWSENAKITETALKWYELYELLKNDYLLESEE